MLKAIESPLACFGLSHNYDDPMCQQCPHAPKCREHMGVRLERNALANARFSLVPEAYVRRWEEPDADLRDIEALYIDCYQQVYGPAYRPGASHGNIGTFRERVVKMAAEAKVPLKTYILVNMFAYSHTHSDKEFTAGLLVDGRAAYRVKVYADACVEQYGAISATVLDVLANSDLAVYDLNQRMLTSEILAGQWIIEYKLWHTGLPYEPMFNDIENQLDPAWLAIETYYQPVLDRYSTRQDQPACKDTLKTRHDTLVIHRQLKKHKHAAIAHFRAREAIMAQAVDAVLHGYSCTGKDFEVENKPICDPLHMWNRLGTALQHLECLVYVNYREGIYATPS